MPDGRAVQKKPAPFKGMAETQLREPDRPRLFNARYRAERLRSLIRKATRHILAHVHTVSLTCGLVLVIAHLAVEVLVAWTSDTDRTAPKTVRWPRYFETALMSMAVWVTGVAIMECWHATGVPNTMLELIAYAHVTVLAILVRAWRWRCGR